MAVPPAAESRDTANFASLRVCGFAGTSVGWCGYTMSASLRPETTAKETPSRRVSMAAMVAFFASAILVTGFAIEPEQSIAMTCAAVGGVVPIRAPVPVAVTVTTASTTVPPAGRYWFW